MYQLIKKNNPAVKFLLIILALSITSEVLRVIFQSPSVSEQLTNTANEVNEHCPIIVDSLMRLDNTVALPDSKFQYNYTFYKTERSDIDSTTLKENMKNTLINKLKTDPKLAIFQQNGVTFAAVFYDKTGKYVCNLLIAPNEYAK
jgi:hypothetical protein